MAFLKVSQKGVRVHFLLNNVLQLLGTVPYSQQRDICHLLKPFQLPWHMVLKDIHALPCAKGE